MLNGWSFATNSNRVINLFLIGLQNPVVLTRVLQSTTNLKYLVWRIGVDDLVCFVFSAASWASHIILQDLLPDRKRMVQTDLVLCLSCPVSAPLVVSTQLALTEASALTLGMHWMWCSQVCSAVSNAIVCNTSDPDSSLIIFHLAWVHVSQWGIS